MKLVTFCLGLGLFLPVARADHRDNDRGRNEPCVIVYQQADFRGSFLVLYPGEAIDNLSGKNYPNGGGMNDTISSVRVEGGAVVYVYEQARYRGAVMRLTESVRDLTARRLPDNPQVSWNDRISSIRVEGARARRGGEREVDVDVVIKRSYHDLLGREPDPQGLRYYHGAMIDQGWTERMVRDHLRRGDEFRREGVDRVIRRAYQDLLGREPDESGLRSNRQKMLENDWSEVEVRDNLRRSPEYLSRSPDKK